MCSRLALAVCALALACTPDRGVHQAPVPAAVEPATGRNDAPVDITVRGERFFIAVTQHLEGGEPLAVDARYEVKLSDVPLEAVTWLDTRTLTARVPAGLQPGPHRLTVTNPAGVSGTLDDAYRSVPLGPPVLSAIARFEPSEVQLDETTRLVVDVTNSGESRAAALVLDAAVAGTCGLKQLDAPSAAELDAGAKLTFTWRFAGDRVGECTAEVRATATDVTSGQPVALAPVRSTPVLVRIPPLVETSLQLDRAVVSTGDVVTLTLAARNTGRVDVVMLQPTAVVSPAGVLVALTTPAARELLSGQSTDFTWTFRAAAPGSASLDVTANGREPLTGLPVTLVPKTAGPVVVEQGALLAVTAAVPMAVSLGQRFTVAFNVQNAGQATARSVSMLPPAVVGTGAVTLETSAPAMDLPGGQSATLSFDYRATGAGEVTFSGTATASDANSGAPLFATLTSGPVTLQQPAQLQLVSFTVPARISRGQSFDAVLTVRNAGEAPASGVLPQPALPAVTSSGGVQLSTASVPAAVTLAGGATHAFTWRYTEQGTGAGAFTLSAGAVGTDANSLAGLTAPAIASPQVTVQAPANLTVLSVDAPARVARGAAFPVTVQVRNDGEATARMVLPAPSPPQLTADGGAAAMATSAPAPADIAGGATASFAYGWSENGTASGTLRFTTGAAGIEDNLGAGVTAAAVSSTGTRVLSPAALSIVSFTLPPVVTSGAPFTAVLVARNSGEALAQAVRASPDPPGATAGSVGIDAGAAGPEDIAPGTSHTFSWQVVPNGTGTLALRAGLTGTDELTGATLSVPQQTTATTIVQAPSALRIVSFSGPVGVNRGRTFAVTMQVQNAGGTAVTGVVPSPLLPTVMTGGGAAASSSTAIAPVTLAAGAMHTFSWTFSENGTGPGTLQLTAGVSGTDAVSMQPVSAAPVTTPVISVQRPAALTASFTVPPRLSRGQGFVASLLVTNTGDATANVVLPTAPTGSFTGGAAASTSSSAQSVTLAGGASTTFNWAYVENGASSGTLALSTNVSATDANDGQPRSVTTTSNTALVERPAALSIAAFTLPSTLSRGQPFTLRLDVTNTGDAAALNVRPAVNPPARNVTGGASASTSSAPVIASLAGGATASLVWSCVEDGTGPGTLGFTASVLAADANSAAALSTGPSTAGPATVQAPAQLIVSSFTAPSTISRGQGFTTLLRITNSGQALALNVRPSPSPPSVSATGGAAAASTSTVMPVTLAGGASHTFSLDWLENGAGAGTLAFSAGASGTDSNSGAALSVTASSSNTVTVQTRAALSGSLVLPQWIDEGSTFTVTLTVNDTGQAAANAVTPSALSFTGMAGATLVSGPTPLTRVISGGGNGTFTWTYQAGGSGTLQASGSASGTDANSGLPVSTGTLTSNVATVEDVQTLASDPFGDGTPFSYVFAYRGFIYLGPRANGTGAVRMQPDGSGPQSVSFTFSRDSTGNSSRSSATAPYTSIGSSGCASNTQQCGPDNEDGLGLFTAGAIAGTEWLIVGGARTAGDFDYVYMTPDPGTSAAFRYVDLNDFLGGNTRGLSAAHVFRDRLYLGFPDFGGNRPYLSVLYATPPVPGLDAVDGVHALDLDGHNMPGLANGDPAMIDAFGDFNDRLYLANAGGWVRSTVNQPRSISSFSGDWAAITPSHTALGNRPSRLTSKAHSIEPADRAVPAFAVFQGRLYAARNTDTGAQLWVCNPTVSPPLNDCDSADWMLIAANSSGDVLHSQFNNPNNTSISLLVATPSHLYVGYDNAVNGVVLFRSNVATPMQRADFVGLSGCSAANHPASCAGLGGNGLQLPATNRKIYSAVSATAAGQSYVYFVTGSGTGGVRVHRVGP